VCSTIGFERDNNPVLAELDEDAFVEEAVRRIGPQPPNFHAIVKLNRGPLVTTGVEVLPLAPRQVEQRCASGALLVDVRTDQQFDDAHIPGSVCIPMLRAGFGSRLAWVAGRDQEIVLIGRDDEDAHHAAELAVAIGMRRIGGLLGGGMTSWRQEGRDVARIPRMHIDELPAQFTPGRGLQVLDVREQPEWASGHIPGSHFIPWHDIDHIPESLDPELPVAVMCGSGQRAAVAASLLQRLGLESVIHVVGGGVGRWKELGNEIETARDTAGEFV
jgi:rhodanese-related sulfurtransferase